LECLDEASPLFDSDVRGHEGIPTRVIPEQGERMMTKTRTRSMEEKNVQRAVDGIRRIPMPGTQLLGQAWDPEMAKAIHFLLFEAGEAAGLLKDYSEDEDLPKQCSRIMSKRLDAAIGELEAILKIRDQAKQRELERAEGGLQE